MRSIACGNTNLEGLSQRRATSEAEGRGAADVRRGSRRLVQREGLHLREAPEARCAAPDRGVLER